MQKVYRVREDAPDEVHTNLGAHPEILRHLLYSRGISDAELAARFLAPSYERDSHDPFLLPDMEIAVERLIAAVRGSELIAVWSDYDCDGIPGGVALVEFLRMIGARVRHYIPHRHEEGYGLNNEGLDALLDEGAKLVVTVDLGTTDIEQIAHAKQRGADVIVTDHHLPHAALPPAIAVVNPHRADSAYPFTDLCGAGVAWKLIQGILSRDRFGVPEGKEKWLLDLVGLATLSDMVELQNENRMLASYGLLVMRRARRPGFAALLKLLRINPRTLSEDDVTFMISPRINAASRMERPETAARLLATRDRAEADELARTLNRINGERKGLVAATVKEAHKRLAQETTKDVIVMGSPHWRPGILGLVANKIAEERGVPVFLWGREGGEALKGSCRSGNTVNVVDLMAGARDVFEDFGGHEFSGGFSLREEHAHELPARLAESYARLQDVKVAAQEIIVDRQLAIADAPGAKRNIMKLSPFGIGNPKPLFLFPNVSIGSMRHFGKAGDHLELVFSQSDARISGVSFFTAPEAYGKSITEGARADVVAHLEQDFRGAPRLRIVDIL